MEGFLFIVGPIWWNEQLPIISILIASTLAMMLVVHRFLKKILPPSNGREEDFIFTAEKDQLWNEKTIERLRSYLASIYFPTNTKAHTTKEIKQYLDNHELVSLLERIEHAEYNNEVIQRDERISINKRLSEILPTLTGIKN